MKKEISCTVCRKDMGEIRDATLRTGIKYICAPCDNRRLELLVALHQTKNKPKSVMEEVFGRDFAKYGG